MSTVPPMAHRMTRRQLVSRLTAGTAVLAVGGPRLFVTDREHRETFRVDAKVRPLVLDDEGTFAAFVVK